MQHTRFLCKNWFPEHNPAALRARIMRQLLQMLVEQAARSSLPEGPRAAALGAACDLMQQLNAVDQAGPCYESPLAVLPPPAIGPPSPDPAVEDAAPAEQDEQTGHRESVGRADSDGAEAAAATHAPGVEETLPPEPTASLHVDLAADEGEGGDGAAQDCTVAASGLGETAGQSAEEPPAAEACGGRAGLYDADMAHVEVEDDGLRGLAAMVMSDEEVIAPAGDTITGLGDDSIFHPDELWE